MKVVTMDIHEETTNNNGLCRDVCSNRCNPESKAYTEVSV